MYIFTSLATSDVVCESHVGRRTSRYTFVWLFSGGLTVRIRVAICCTIFAKRQYISSATYLTPKPGSGSKCLLQITIDFGKSWEMDIVEALPWTKLLGEPNGVLG